MKTKTNNQTGLNNLEHSIHMKVEYFFRHRAFLAVVLLAMTVGLLKYQENLKVVLRQISSGDVAVLNNYLHHDEITRMPINYGVRVRYVSTSDE